MQTRQSDQIVKRMNDKIQHLYAAIGIDTDSSSANMQDEAQILTSRESLPIATSLLKFCIFTCYDSGHGVMACLSIQLRFQQTHKRNDQYTSDMITKLKLLNCTQFIIIHATVGSSCHTKQQDAALEWSETRETQLLSAVGGSK